MPTMRMRMTISAAKLALGYGSTDTVEWELEIDDGKDYKSTWMRVLNWPIDIMSLEKTLTKPTCVYIYHIRPDASRRQWGQLPLLPLVFALYPLKCSNRKLQIPHRGALYQRQIALPLQV